jgi:hypothetical protein
MALIGHTTFMQTVVHNLKKNSKKKYHMTKFHKCSFLLFISFLFLNCSSNDDDGTTEDTVSIIGNWSITSFKIDGIERLENILMDNDGCPFELIFTLSTSQVIEYGGTDCIIIEERTPEQYCINDTSLIFDCTQGGENGIAEILELTNTTLKYLEVNTLGEVERTFTRQ